MGIKWDKKERLGVNFINILQANFWFERLLGSFFLVTCKKKKLPKRLLYKKFRHKMLMKLTIEVNVTNILQAAFAPIFFRKKLKYII